MPRGSVVPPNSFFLGNIPTRPLPSSIASHRPSPPPSGYRLLSSLDFILLLGTRTSATAAGAARRSPAAASATLSWRGPHEGKVDRYCLVQQLGAVGAVDGGTRLLQRRVFNQDVALSRGKAQRLGKVVRYSKWGRGSIGVVSIYARGKTRGKGGNADLDVTTPTVQVQV